MIYYIIFSIVYDMFKDAQGYFLSLNLCLCSCVLCCVLVTALAGSGGYTTFTAGTPGTAAHNSEDSFFDSHGVGEEKPKSMLVLSGGEGYVDFRIGKTLLKNYNSDI